MELLVFHGITGIPRNRCPNLSRETWLTDHFIPMDPRARRDDDDHDAIDLEHLEKMLRFLKEKKGRFVPSSTPFATTEEDV